MSVDEFSIKGKQYCIAKEYEKAIYNYNIALELLHKQSKIKPQKYYLILNSLGNVYYKNLQYNEALECYLQIIDFMKHRFGPKSKEVQVLESKILNIIKN
jgi:tetratricopeptide (TPR) repeat protein